MDNYFCRWIRPFGYLFRIASFVIITNSTTAQPDLSLTPVINNLSSPIQMVNAGDGSNRIFVVQKGGTILVYAHDYDSIGNFLTVSGITTNGERGLLSMAFHPGYNINGFFFVFYTNGDGDLEIARYKVSDNENIADPSSKIIVLTIPHPDESNHNGGELHFGNDGFLYLSTGDGGGGGDELNNAQNTTKLLGKMLRLAVNTSPTTPYYTIPAGNPFGNEVYDLGLRNPFRWSFDRETHDMWIGDVGQDSWEEINFRPAASPAGINYGWRCYEGNSSFITSGCGVISDYIFPVHTYATQNPSAAITGGVVYRGLTYPFLQGYYISADFFSGTFYKIRSDGTGGWITSLQTISPTGIVDFGETEDGEIYAVSLTANRIYLIEATEENLPVTLIQFTAIERNNVAELNWKTASEQNIKEFEIESGTNENNFSGIGNVKAQNASNGASYRFTHLLPNERRTFYRLKMIDIDGSYQYSHITSIFSNEPNANFVYPSNIRGGVMKIFLPEAYTTLEIISSTGEIVYQQNIPGRTGRLDIPVYALASGTYVVRLTGNQKRTSQKIFIRSY